MRTSWRPRGRGVRWGRSGAWTSARHAMRSRRSSPSHRQKPARACPDWEPALLQSGDVALYGADADLECGGELFGSAASGTGTPEIFADRVEPVGAVHA